MVSDQTLTEFKVLFSDSFSQNPEVRTSIRDLSAALPTEKLRQDVSALAKWLHAAGRNAATRSSNTTAKLRAVAVENRMLRQLPPGIDPNRRDQLHQLMVQAGGNVLITHDSGSIRNLEAFLISQTKRRVVYPDIRKKMTNTG